MGAREYIPEEAPSPLPLATQVSRIAEDASRTGKLPAEFVSPRHTSLARRTGRNLPTAFLPDEQEGRDEFTEARTLAKIYSRQLSKVSERPS